MRSGSHLFRLEQDRTYFPLSGRRDKPTPAALGDFAHTHRRSYVLPAGFSAAQVDILVWVYISCFDIKLPVRQSLGLFDQWLCVGRNFWSHLLVVI